MSLPRLDLRHLRYFIAVVEQRTFRAAALRLHVSQPPLTRQIRQLEDVLKVQLLHRSAHGAQPTPAGLVFYEEARNLLMQVEQATERTQRAAEGRARRLDIAVYGSAVLGAIPRILHRFREVYPQVEVILHSLDRAGQIEALRERRISLGFNRFFTSEPDLSWEVIQTERMYVVIPEKHVLASREVLSLADVGRHPLILYPRAPRPGFIDQMMAMFELRHITPNVSQEVDDLVTAIGLVASGAGLCLVTDSGRTLRIQGTVQIPLRKADQATVDLCIIHRTGDASPLLADFLAIARSMREHLGSSADASDTAGAIPGGAKRKRRSPKQGR